MRSPGWNMDGPRLSGTWVGSRRSRSASGVWRLTAVRITLRTDGAGGLGGELELYGALDAGPGRKLGCVDRSAASLRRLATLTVGQYGAKRARFGLAAPTMEGERGCAAAFPLFGATWRRCTLSPTRPGRVRLRCGELALSLRRVSLTGVWGWDEVSADRSGDTIRRHMRLHLVHSGDRLAGYADDIRTRISGDQQRYRCNGRLSYVRQGRHRLRGRLRGLQFGLQVRETRPSRGPCQGTLGVPETWQGRWDPIRDEIKLTLGSHEHTLWRRPAKSPAAPDGPAR